MNGTQQKMIEFIKDVADNYDSKPDGWASCGQCENNKLDAEDLLELIKKETQPTDTEMLDWLVKNASWVADIFYVTHIEGRSDDEYPTTRQLIAAEMAKEVK